MPAFVLDGAEELKRKLRTLKEGREVRALIRATLHEAAEPVLATSRVLAPVGESGRLRARLQIRAAKRSRRFIAVVVRPGTRAEMGIPASAKGYYPVQQELGAYEGRLRQTRFLRGAIDREREKAIGILSVGIGQGIERLAARRS